MAAPKTQLAGQSVPAFIKSLDGDQRKKDCTVLVRLMRQASGEPARMYGPSIIGCGSQPIQYASSKTGAWPIVAFSPRKSDLTLYVGRGAKDFDALLGKLGACKMAGGCLHIKRLSDVDLKVLAKLLAATVKARKKKQG